jgi:NAD+ synthase
MSAKDRVREKLHLNAELAVQALVSFIKDAVETTRSAGVVVGLSGGVDSALSAALAVGALGPERVHAFMLPHRTSSPDSVSDAEVVAKALGLATYNIDISPMVDVYFDQYEPDPDKVRLGNKMARERMSILYDQAKKLHSLVLGTSNKTEILLGYSTIFGDNASSINPLGDLYKQQVWQLATYLDLPAQIVDKKPSADLWPGQTDEEELGFDYPTADEVLYLMFNFGLAEEEVIALDYPQSVVSRIVTLEENNRFKRRLMLIARLSDSAINLDREIPRD